MFWYVFTYFKLWKLEIPGAKEEIPKLKEQLGKISFGEIWALICIGIGLTLWITEELHHIKSGMVALITATSACEGKLGRGGLKGVVAFFGGRWVASDL